MTINLPFDLFLAVHIVAGAIGAVAFWIPVGARKGGAWHRKGGNVFYWCMLVTGSAATGMSLSTLIATPAVHHDLTDQALIRGIFGWMMLYLSVFTLSLAWHGMMVLRNKADHAANREAPNTLLQLATMGLAVNCVVQGVLIGQPLMMGIAIVGFVSGVTNLWFAFRPASGRKSVLKEHVKALVGAGISVYTAFMAFGSVRVMPALALNPVAWSVPLSIGIGLIIYHHWRIDRAGAGRERRAAEPARAGG